MTAIFINELRLEPNESRLYIGHETVELQPKCTTLLAVLASRPGEVITKEALLAQVWQGRVVGEDVLTTTVRKLRKALNDDAKNPQYIETINKKGYRLIADVNPQRCEKAPSRQFDRRLWLLLLPLLAVIWFASHFKRVEVYEFSDSDTPQQRAMKLKQLNERVTGTSAKLKTISFSTG